MKKFIATFMLMAIVAVILPLTSTAQTMTTTKRVYNNGRRQTVRVVTKTNRGNHYGWRNKRNRTATVTPQERRRLMRQRNRIVTLQNRVTRDGIVTNKENRKVNKRINKYERKVTKARNN